MFAIEANKLRKLLHELFAYVRMQSLAQKKQRVRSRSNFYQPYYGKPIVNANLTISTNYGDRHALVTSSLAGKCASVMPAAAAARAWVVGGTGNGSKSTGNQVARSLFGTAHIDNELGGERKISIRRFSKPRVANA